MNPFLSTYIIIFHFILLSFSYEYIIHPVDNKYPRIKVLPSGEFFIIMSNGIYISNNDFSNITQIHQFMNAQCINSNEDNNKTALSEFKNGNDFYILSLVKDYLFLYDFNKQQITQYDLRADLNGNFCEIIPYKMVNNCLFYVITFALRVVDLEIHIIMCYIFIIIKLIFRIKTKILI